MQRFLLIILTTFAFLATPAIAANGWIVSQRSGDARVVRSGLQPAALKANAVLAPGDVVVTGASGRATLARGSDYIVIAPRSELRLPAAPEPRGFTRVVQQLGTMLFKVRHTGVPHFAVDTPMLAAVVKGTTFTVVVDKDRSAVQVIEGAVQVTAADGGMQQLIRGGNTVFIDRHEPRKLITADAETLGASNSASDAAVHISGSGDESLYTIAGLTAGLVRVPNEPVQSSQVAAVAVPASTAPAGTTPAVAGTTVTPVSVVPAATVPGVTTPAVALPGVTVPGVTTPAVTTPSVTTPAVTTPIVTIPAVTTPTVTIPAVTTPTVTVPTVTIPAVTTPTITVPAVTVPAVTTPVVTIPAVTTPTITVPPVTVPTVTIPAVTTPVVTIPAVTPPTITVPPVTVPTVAIPAVTVPTVTIPTVTVPTVTVPSLPLFGP